MDIVSLAKRYAELDVRRKMCEGELDAIKEEMRQIEDILADQMVTECPTIKVRVSSGDKVFDKTVYVSSRLYASIDAEKKQDAVKEFRNYGLGYLVTESINSNTLSAYLREVDRERSMTEDEILEQLPSRLREFVKVKKQVKVSCR